MPARPNVPGVIKSILTSELGTQLALNIMYWAFTGSTSPTLMSDLATAIAGAWNTEMNPNLSSDIVLKTVETIDLTTDTSPTGVADVSFAGAQSGSPISAQIAFCISEEISRRYRGGHPRKYVCGVPGEGSFTSSFNEWSDTAVTDLTLGFADFVTSVESFSTGGLAITNEVNVSFFTDHALRVTPVVDDITSWVGRKRFCSQRRRLGQIGG